ncbi:mannitol dehydrogenase family protein [Bifidobacterium sp. 82T10]|uniref:Mannitol dehydrogenase family protein n=1 Tax=Bifidobacterium miconis TaxID=2834435 RepID=A0ABS6WHF1_9BIFI|nr:mannitol dehydrogenase family protein [Bifidobacterium miconis]MBW3093392.1 mannitol dehydrogenase family protein [Bifidobacterium miconis]
MTVHLTDDFAANYAAWRDAGIAVPGFDPKAVRDYTEQHPYWIHFGAGNLFRAVHAPIAQDLIENGETKAGILVAETFDADIIDLAYKPFDNRCLQVVLNADGSVDSRLIASVADAFGIRAHDGEWDRLAKVFRDPQLQFVTVTITEKGYALTRPDGELLPWIKPEADGGPDKAVSAMGAITALLFERFKAGAAPIAMVSTDNFSQNGDRFAAAIRQMAGWWHANGFVGSDFLDYVKNPAKVSFPLSMIDRITPNPAEAVSELLAKQGFGDTEIIHTPKRTNVAPFANTEKTWYLVIEDAFPNGRPDLTKAGVYLADRDTVNEADEMKVTTCLNPLHTALATFGMLLGYPSMSKTIADPTLRKLVERLGYTEGLPVVTDPGIFSPKEFLRQVIEERVPNPNIPDTPARISTDTSQKIPIRYGVTIGKYLKSDTLDAGSLVAIPLTIAGWLRLLLGADGKGTRDDGSEVTLSSDPRLADLQAALAGLTVGGDLADADAKLRPILADAAIFGTDLNATPLADKIIGYFREFAAGTGTVDATIAKALK